MLFSCVDLLQEIQVRVKPQYHLFGHIHEGKHFCRHQYTSNHFLLGGTLFHFMLYSYFHVITYLYLERSPPSRWSGLRRMLYDPIFMLYFLPMTAIEALLQF